MPCLKLHSGSLVTSIITSPHLLLDLLASPVMCTLHRQWTTWLTWNGHFCLGPLTKTGCCGCKLQKLDVLALSVEVRVFLMLGGIYLRLL